MVLNGKKRNVSNVKNWRMASQLKNIGRGGADARVMQSGADKPGVECSSVEGLAGGYIGARRAKRPSGSPEAPQNGQSGNWSTSKSAARNFRIRPGGKENGWKGKTTAACARRGLCLRRSFWSAADGGWKMELRPRDKGGQFPRESQVSSSTIRYTHGKCGESGSNIAKVSAF